MTVTVKEGEEEMTVTVKEGEEEMTVTVKEEIGDLINTRNVNIESFQIFSCTGCPFSFTSQIFLLKHIKRCHHDEYVRLLRSGEIRSENLMSSSSSQHHGTTIALFNPAPTRKRRDTDEPRPHCSQCGESFTTGRNLIRHQPAHSHRREAVPLLPVWEVSGSQEI
ncbi:histone-lysine N-methyltransferase PRDM9-like isoform X1 [Oncorhynchus tshawytscha]|uniref:histone-lysine N-methyltransferase PRDM9-like isoform X1 n=1 Tax=Oncorhynchus tshawytscha TaxID=74940 RepID=UPI001C3D9E93|nr:histone-lysine N-methyltransferase PRDM9-like isoform X1 [Oncorhynchus tshawytscha]